ncbi:NmrA family NAD(P)-binding protein [Streptomyces sp. NPDC021608]|uniref:NmrA family NAD(P)-binding protein n=1 Tax=Streptomyces sp. NPDC021608 TaxID=3154903 RepID=UPI0033FBA6A4
MSNLLVLGGSGCRGARVLEYAARRGHRVRALVRSPDEVQALSAAEQTRGSSPGRSYTPATGPSTPAGSSPTPAARPASVSP